MQQIFQQEEWHGIARRGPQAKDPYASYTELNTMPGSNTLQRITSRRPYLSGRLPIPAARFDDFCGMYRLYDNGGNNIHISKQGAQFEAHVCFKVDDYAALDASGSSTKPYLFGCGSEPDSVNNNWGFWIEKSGDDWYLRAEVRDGANSKVLDATTALVSGSWYWARLTVTSDTATLRYYKDGSDSLVESAISNATLTRPGFSADTEISVTVGNTDHARYPVYRGSIAFASLGSTLAVPTTWETSLPAQGGEYDCVFRVHDPNYSIQPALLEDSTNKYHWRQHSRPYLDTVTRSSATNGLFDTKGFWMSQPKGCVLNTPGVDIFRQRTVFMFLATFAERVTFLRSYDSTFSIDRSAVGQISVTWPPADPSKGSVSLGRLANHISSGLSTATDVWFAVELDPSNSTSAANVTVYEYDSAGATWTDRSSGGSGTRIGNGVLSIDSSEWVLAESPGRVGNNYLQDFRLIVGDDGWQTAHNATAITSYAPPSLASWLQLDEGTRWPLIQNVSSAKAIESNDVFDPVIAYSDRVDGVMRYTRNPYQGVFGYDGCTHLDNGMLPRVQDATIGVDGTVSGATDSFFFSDVTASPQRQANSQTPQKMVSVGSHNYVSGPGPMQFIYDTARLLGWSRAEVDSHAASTSESTATVDFGGQLSWSTNYQYKVTHYDPVNGNESNAYGPYRFTTDTAPGDTSVPYGSGGASFKVETTIYTTQDLSGQELRYYRYHDSTGRYFLEGSGKISNYQIGSSYKVNWNSEFTFTMADDDLLLYGKELELDNDSPPAHIACTIWNGRAFYVDALRPSRLWFSKPYQFGSVPKSNVLWTDEGAGGNILGFLPGFGGLLVLREHSIWVIPQFTVAEQAYTQPLIPDVGCVSGGAACFAEGVLWWASPGGVYSFTGNETPFNHSERLDGLDWQVWDHAPRKTRAYYNKADWVVVITCDGSGISFDIRSGAAALVSAPETIAIQANTSTYSGPLYCGDGMIWRNDDVDTKSNHSLSLDSSAAMLSYDLGPEGATGNWSTANWYWVDAGTSGTSMCALTHDTTLTSADNMVWLTPTSYAGQTFAWNNLTKDDIWTLTIQDSASPTTAFVKTLQPFTEGWVNVGRLPMYYKSQDIFFGRNRDAKIFDRLEFVTTRLYRDTSYSSATGTVAFYSYISGGTAQTAKATAIDVSQDAVHQLPCRLRGMKARYEVETNADFSFQPIDSMAIHFRLTKPRGRPT